MNKTEQKEENRLGLNSKWYPQAVHTHEYHLQILIKTNIYIQHEKIYPLRKNLAYSLQYIEFLSKLNTDIYMSSVLKKQNIKSIVIHSATIIEAIFYYLVVSNGLSNTTKWAKTKSISTGEYSLLNNTMKNEIIIYEKLKEKIIAPMTFDQISKKVEKKKLLGKSFDHYHKISAIRRLRNKIHIHDSDHNFDTDFNNFSNKELVLVFDVLHSILISELFKESDYRKNYAFLLIDS